MSLHENRRLNKQTSYFDDERLDRINLREQFDSFFIHGYVK